MVAWGGCCPGHTLEAAQGNAGPLLTGVVVGLVPLAVPASGILANEGRLGRRAAFTGSHQRFHMLGANVLWHSLQNELDGFVLCRSNHSLQPRVVTLWKGGSATNNGNVKLYEVNAQRCSQHALRWGRVELHNDAKVVHKANCLCPAALTLQAARDAVAHNARGPRQATE